MSSDGPKVPDSMQSGAVTGHTSPPRWARLHLWQIQWVRDVLMILAVVGLFWFGYKISIVTVPLLLAILLAYLVEPLVRRMTRIGRLSRDAAASVIIAATVLVVLFPLTLGLFFGGAQLIEVSRRLGGQAQNFTEALSDPQQRKDLSGRWQAILDVYEMIAEEAQQQRQAQTGAPAEPDPKEVAEAAEAAAQAPEAATGRPPFVEPQDPDEVIGKDAANPLPEKPVETPAEAAADSDKNDLLTPGERILSDPGEERGEGEPTPLWLEFLRETGLDTLVKNLIDQTIIILRDNAGVLSERLGNWAVLAGREAVRFIAGVAIAFGKLTFGLFLTLFFFFFVCRSFGRLLAFSRTIVPERQKGITFDLARKMDAVISGFVRGRIVIMLILTALFIIGYWAVGVPAPIVVGLIVGLLSVVPYLSLVGIPLAIILMILDPVGEGFRSSWWWILLAPTALYWIIQWTDDYIWTPLIQGKTTDMETPTILFSVLAGAAIAGFYGVLIAIPVGACAKIVFRDIIWPHIRAWARGEAEDFLPIDRD